MKKSLLTPVFLFAVLLNSSCKKEKLPELSTYEISGITVNSAVSGGVVTSDGGAGIISRGICWSQQTGPEMTGKATSDGTGEGSFISNLTGLSPATKYYVRAYATNSVGVSYGEEKTFTTLGALPLLTDFSISELTTTNVVLHGTINPGELPTDVHFEYGTTASYGSSAQGSTSQLTGNTSTAVSTTISSLLPGTVYHYRIVAVNQLGTSYSADQTFTTLGQKPSYTEFLVTGATTSDIKLGIKVNPNYLSSAVTVEYGTTETYGSTIIPADSPLTGNSPISMNIKISNLLPGKTYYFRVKLENSLGVTNTEGKSYKTYNTLDADNNGYYSVIIGAQEWFSENLRTTHFSNGDAIPKVSNAYDWSAIRSAAYCIYKDEEPGVYGNLYNFYVASDSRNVCPAGWHVPSITEWNTLIAFLGGINDADTKMREAGLVHWFYDTGATNSTGMTLLPAGNRESDGTYYNRRSSAYVWSSTSHSENGIYSGMLISLEWNAPKIVINPYGQTYGASIRCLKN